MYTLFHIFSHSCFISDIGVFFGAFLVPIIFIMIFNVCIFISSSYVVIKLKISQQKRNQPLSNIKKKVPAMSSKDTCKLLALLAGFMFLLGLSWLILMFTVVGADTNIYAAFAIQWLFVFFNSLQGFFLFVFFVALNRDARKLWLVCFHSCYNRSSTKFKYNLSSAEKTASTKLAEYSHSDDMKGKQNRHTSETATTSIHFETITSNDNNTSAGALLTSVETKPHAQIQMKRWSTFRKTHDVETAEIVFNDESDQDLSSCALDTHTSHTHTHTQQCM